MSSDKHLRCSFCGKSKDSVKKFISGPSVYICNECISLCNEILAEEEEREQADAVVPSPTPVEIKEVLDQYVIGQEDAKRALSVAVYNHYKRVNHQGVLDEVEIDKANILLMGPTGVGKTLLAQTLARILQVPFTIADATTLTEAGYVGEDVENIWSGCSRPRTSTSRSASAGSSTSTRSTRSRASPRTPQSPATCRARRTAGAAQDPGRDGGERAATGWAQAPAAGIHPDQYPEHPVHLRRGVRRAREDRGVAHRQASDRLRRETTGSGSEEERKELLSRVEPEDLQRFGLIPELVGRLPVSVPLSDLDEDALCRILVEPKNALVKQYAKMFELEGIGLTFDKDAIRAIAHKTLDRGTGARGLRSVIEGLMRDVMFDIPSRADVREVVVTTESVQHGTPPLLVLGPEPERKEA